MALLDFNRILKIDKSSNNVHRVVESTYTVFKDSNGQKYFQIDTYGSENREIKNKVSQSIQFDDETAHFLIKLISKELDL